MRKIEKLNFLHRLILAFFFFCTPATTLFFVPLSSVNVCVCVCIQWCDSITLQKYFLIVLFGICYFLSAYKRRKCKQWVYFTKQFNATKNFFCAMYWLIRNKKAYVFLTIFFILSVDYDGEREKDHKKQMWVGKGLKGKLNTVNFILERRQQLMALLCGFHSLFFSFISLIILSF